jgi:hypothetical protein
MGYPGALAEQADRSYDEAANREEIEMADVTKYKGSCHCGKVRFEVQTDLASVISCNCSICSRAGYLLTFVPATQFKLQAGKDEQTDYQFNKKHIHHLFCKTCGTRSFGYGAGPDGSEMYAVNVRVLEGVNADDLKVTKVDGKSA